MKHTSPRLRRIQARRLSRQPVAKAGEGVYSKELMASINSRVDEITAERLAPPMPELSVDDLLVKLQEKVQSMATRSSDQMRQLQRIFGNGANEDLRLDAFKGSVGFLEVVRADFDSCFSFFASAMLPSAYPLPMVWLNVASW